MKKVFSLFLLTGLCLLASCQKPETPIVPEESLGNVTLNFNFSLQDDAVGTKAVKAAWETGDLIYLFLNEEGNTDVANLKYAIVQFDGSSWNVIEGQSNLNALTATSGAATASFIPGAQRSVTYTPSWSASTGAWYTERCDNQRDKAYGSLKQSSFNYTFDSSTKVVSGAATFSQWGLQLTFTNITADQEWELLNLGDNTYFQLCSINCLVAIINGTDFRVFESDSSTNACYGLEATDGVVFYGDWNSSGKSKPIALGLRSNVFNKTFKKTLDSSNLFSQNFYKLAGPVLDASGNLVTGSENGWSEVL